MTTNSAAATVPAPAQPLAAVAGWYSDPSGRGQRYWDGSSWTDNIAPPAEDKTAASTGDWVAGVLLSLLFPIIGAIVGLVYLSKGGEKRQVGITCLVISVISFIVIYAIVN